jgi:peptidoglycan hydrolase CwlO-like protein
MVKASLNLDRFWAILLILAIFFAFPLSRMANGAANEDEIKDDISDIEKKLQKEQSAKARLEAQLRIIQSSVNATQEQIQETENLIQEIQASISRKEGEIKELSDKIDFQKIALRSLIQELYYQKKSPTAGFLLDQGSAFSLVRGTDRTTTLEQKLVELISDIEGSKIKVAKEKESLAENQGDHEKLLKAKEVQQQRLIADKQETQGDISEKDATIGELNAKLGKLRSDLSSLLGEDLSTDDIVEAAKIAGKATGVRKDFILGELVVETDLGRFTGGCTYKNIRMKSADKTEFLKIASELEKAYGGNYKNKKLSCSPGYGYGGAMGVAQFMPTTWKGYKSYISSATGHNPPDPWNIIDGVMGMAKKLANGGATSKGGERLASKRYFCGGPSSPYWNNKCEKYASNVQYWANNYEKKL